ncbi:MAG: hypothetical protein QN120_10980 [Armatimonadota bacterium]|nr:hypothetical protein [Armatimonadota bacterium]
MAVAVTGGSPRITFDAALEPPALADTTICRTCEGALVGLPLAS